MMDPRILSLDSLSSNKKSLTIFLKSPNNQSVFKAQPELYAYLYVNKFNTTLQSMQENAYKSKNTDLFTWKQSEKYQNKIVSPPSIDKKMVQMSVLVNAHQNGLNSVSTEPGLYTQTAPDMQGPRSMIAMDGTGSGVYQPRRKKLQKTQKKFYDTHSGTFKTQIKLDSHKFTLPTPQITKREKTYSVMAVQKGLIDDRDSPLHQVPNYQYMSNQFDRRNQTVNKIISKIRTKEDLLNREQVIEETLQKMEYVVKDIKLHKFLKPKTAAPFFNTRKPLSMSKTHRDTDYLGNANNNNGGGIELVGSKSARAKSQKSNPYNNELYKSGNFAQTATGFRNSIPAIEKLPEELFVEEPPLKIIDKNDLHQRVQLMRKVHGIEKNDTKALIQNIDSALGKFQIGTLEDTEETVSRPVTNAEKERKEPKFVVRLQSRGSPLKKSMASPKGTKAFGPLSARTTREWREVRESNIMTSTANSGLPKLSEDNILNFGTYFKKKYMEHGLPFDMSKDLSAKIRNFESNIGQSMKRINTPRKDELKFTEL